MRTFTHAMVLATTFLALAATSASADDTRKQSKFKEPRLGLGAEIPDDLLFADPSGINGDQRARVTVRKRRPASPRISKNRPILHGWVARTTPAKPTTSWQTSEPIRPGCLDHHAIMSAMIEAGWSEFTRPSLRPRSMAFNAKRRDGRTKRVQIDRCTGEIIHVSAAHGG